MTKSEFYSTVNDYTAKIAESHCRSHRVALINKIIALHVARCASFVPVVRAHIEDVFSGLLTDEQREQMSEEQAKWVESIEDFISRYHELEPDHPRFARLMKLRPRLEHHNTHHHICLKHCEGCRAEMIANLINRAISRGLQL